MSAHQVPRLDRDRQLRDPAPATAIDASPTLAPGSDAVMDDGSALLAPTLGDPGRGFDLAGAALDGLENLLGTLPADKHLALAQLDDGAAKQLADVDHHVDLAGGGSGGSGSGSAGGHDTPPQHDAPPKFASRHKRVPKDRKGMESAIRAEGAREEAELDSTLQAQLADLDKTFGAEQAKLDGDVAAGDKRAGADVAANDKTLAGDIASRDRANQRQVAGEKAKDAREAATQHAALARTADDARGWHEATRDQIFDEYIKPAMTTHVTTTRALGKPLAAQATTIGAAHAAEAGTNATRAQQAQMIANATAATMPTSAEAEAQKLAAEGQHLLDVQKQRTEAATQAITKEEGAQGKRIDEQATIAGNQMQLQTDVAHAHMQAERGTFATQVAAAAGTAHGAMDAERSAAKKRGDALKAETATKLRDTAARQKAQIDAKVNKLLADIAGTADKDLERTSSVMGRELDALDDSERGAVGSMSGQARTAESTIAKEDAAHDKKIHAEAAKARAAIAKAVQDARKRIVAANAPTERNIDASAKIGREAIHNVGGDAQKQLTAFSDKRQASDAAASDKDLAGYDKDAAAATKRLTDAASGVATAIDKTWVDDVMKGATKSLDGEGFFGPTDDEATAGMRAITSLPPRLQGEAIAKLSDDQFENLLSSVPNSKREELATLVKNTTTNPYRKLKLWGVYHKAHVMADVMREKVGSDPESQRLHYARFQAAQDTAAEVDEEEAFLAQQVAKTGKMYTAHDVDELIARKDAEHAMEMKYGINFTTDGGARADGTHMGWSQPELAELDKTLSQMPADHRAAVTEFHRQEHVYWDPPTNKVEVGAEATGTKVLMPDQATTTTPEAGKQRQLARPELGADISHMEWVTTHELGHIVSNKYSALEQKYERINGWQSYDQGTGNLTDAEKATIDAKRGNRFDNRATVDKDGKTYEVDQDSTGYISYTQGALPDSPEWSYAKTRGYEQFAEHYDMALHTPEKVYDDLVTSPHAETERLRQQVAAAPNDAARAALQGKLKIAEEAERVRRQSYDLMRNEVFGSDKEQAAAEARLARKGVDPAKLAEFRARAAQASTPEQIDVLEKSYQ